MANSTSSTTTAAAPIATQNAPVKAASPSATDVAWTYALGLSVMGTTAPLIHPLNVIAAGAAKTQLTTGKAAAEVYKGLGGNPHNAPRNFWSGITGHLSKELVRSWGRIGGVIYIEPAFKERFSPSLAPHMLACVMATYEVFFANPADVWKSYRSTGLTIQRTDFFKGSLGNFGRQYMMWFVWSKSIPPITKFQKDTLGVEPGSKAGIGIRSVMQAGVCTMFTYPTELILRTVQVRSADYPVKTFGESVKFTMKCATNPSLISEGAYASVVRDLVRANGIRGLGLGMTAKFVGNTMLLGGANYLPMITAWARGK